MFESIKVANLLQKHESHNPQAGWEGVFQMAFQNNRKIAARFFGKTLGAFQTGAPADIIVVNYYPPTPITSKNAYFHILFGISGDMVDTTMVGGNILMEDREISGLDYERIVRRGTSRRFLETILKKYIFKIFFKIHLTL
jgi:cytosine/adenosine deaminase-related metal-dependent hydrolase